LRHILDTWQRPEGRLLFSAGNGINGDCPLASLEALHEEACDYGRRVLGKHASNTGKSKKRENGSAE
jgi:hypothetical protein